jgi:hypothetical protein
MNSSRCEFLAYSTRLLSILLRRNQNSSKWPTRPQNMHTKASPLGLGILSSHLSLGWRMALDWMGNEFGWFECFLFFMVAGDRNKFRSTLLILFLTSLKPNPQSVCGFGCTLLNPAQILLNHFLTQNGFLKTRSQISDLLLKLGVLFGSMKKLTLERDTCFTWRR